LLLAEAAAVVLLVAEAVVLEDTAQGQGLQSPPARPTPLRLALVVQVHLAHIRV
jgi:hypothetical protein